MESINGTESIAGPTITRGSAPKHTQPDHRKCAYRPSLEWDKPPARPRATFLDMDCEHGVSAGGAFYSEDYVRVLELILENKGIDPKKWFEFYEERYNP